MFQINNNKTAFYDVFLEFKIDILQYRCVCRYMYITTVNENSFMNLKESKEVFWECLEGGMGNDVLILNLKK